MCLSGITAIRNSKGDSASPIIIIIIIIIVVVVVVVVVYSFMVFFLTSALAGDLSLIFVWQQISLNLKDACQYSSFLQ